MKCVVETRDFSGEVIERTFDDLKKGKIVGRVVMKL